jgi:predicted Zn-dependent protease
MRFPIARRSLAVHTRSALKNVLLFLAVLAGLTSSVFGQQVALGREARGLLQGALTDFDNKKYDDALTKLTELDKKLPDDPFVMNLLGAAHTKKKDYGQARQYFDRALEKQPNFFPAKFNLGELLFLERKYPEALEFFRQMQLADPANELLQFKVFLCEFQMGNSDAAAKALKKIRYPGDTPAWYYAQAAWESKKGDAKKAREYVKGARFIFGPKVALFEETFQDIGLNIR